MGGVQVYKMVITILPLIPIVILLVQNGIYVNELLANQNSIIATESQVRILFNNDLAKLPEIKFQVIEQYPNTVDYL